MQIKHLSAAYGKREILHDLSFELKPQKLTVLIGKNGSGKSTLLRAITGGLPHTGEILLAGAPLRALPPRERAKRVALLPQILPGSGFSLEQLAAMGRNPYLGLTGRLSPADREKIEEALAVTGLQDLRHQPVARLSGGERQKAYLAMILAQDAELLLLDEPTTYMDMGSSAAFLALLRSLAKDSGKTILAVLHDLNAAAAYAEELLILDQGTLCYTGPAEEALCGDLIPRLFGVEKTTVPSPDGKPAVFFH